MNKGAYCHNCSVWYTLIIVWMAEGREAGVVMTAPLSQQLSLPRWKRLESTVKNASEIYRPAVGLRIRGVKHGWCPQDQDPLWDYKAKSQRNTIEGLCDDKGDPVSCFCQFLPDAHLSSMASRIIKRLTVTFNLTLQGDTKSFPADACGSIAFSYSDHCFHTTARYALALTSACVFNFPLVLICQNI